MMDRSTDDEMARYYEAEAYAQLPLSPDIFKNKKTVFNTSTRRNDLYLPMDAGGFVKIGEEDYDELADARSYMQSLGSNATASDLELAGFSQETIDSLRGATQVKTGRSDPLTPGEITVAERMGGRVFESAPEKLSIKEQISRGIIGGLRDAGQEAINVRNELAEILAPYLDDLSPEARDAIITTLMGFTAPRAEDGSRTIPDLPEVSKENASAAEGVLRSLVQFGAGAAAAPIRGAGMAAQMGRGAVADALFDPKEGNLSTMLKEFGLEGAVLDFLDSKVGEEASAEERLRARVKQSLEGAGLGALVDGAIAGFRAIRSDKGLTETVRQSLADTATNVDGAIAGAFTKTKEALDAIAVPNGTTMYSNPILGAGEEIQKALQLFDQSKIRREKTTGRYVGGPSGLNTPQKLASLRKKAEGLALQGAPGRFWYERSGKAILDAVGGDKAEAELIAQAIAITSSQTKVAGNFDFALQAYLQHKAGQPIQTGRFPKAMSKRLTDMFAGTPWPGRKTNSFYVNLMRVIDPTLEQPVTVDLWMLRAFGFNSDNASDKQYTFIENEVNRLADRLGWEPQQVQSAIWVKAKADDEGITVDQAKFDYSDALQNNKMQISWESIPGRTSGHMLEMFDAPYKVQQQYHVDISKAFLDDNGNDIVALRLGIPTPGDFEAPGYFEGKVSPGTQTELAVPKQFKGPTYGAVEPAALELVNAYAAVRGILMKQDGVGFHRPFFKATKKDSQGVLIDIGRAFSERETKRLGEIMAELSGHTDYNPIAAPGGVRLINFAFARKNADGTKAMSDTWFSDDMLRTNKEFYGLVKQAVAKLDLDDDLSVKLGTFNAQEGYVGNDWSVNKNGEDYLRNTSFSGSSDLQRKVRDIITELSPRIDAVDADYQIQFGFTANTDINQQFRKQVTGDTAPGTGASDGN